MPIPDRKSPGKLALLFGTLGMAVALLHSAPGGAQETAPPEEKPEATGPSSTSQEGVEEIIVKGAESAVATDFAVADSVTAFSAADLVALGAANIADLAAFTPNLEIVSTGATTATFFIRGVGLNDFGANATSAVSVYQDDVPMNSQALQLGAIFDMESVNILRGPQGTGLARNASAGAIKLYPRKPSGQFQGFLRSDLGSYNAQEYEGAIEAPIFEDILSGRFAFKYQKRDGTMENRCGSLPPIASRPILPGFLEQRTLRKTPTSRPWSMCGEPVDNFPIGAGRSDVPAGLPDWVNDRNKWAARGMLLFEPTLDTTFLLGAHGQRRNELTRLGQSYGVAGAFWCLNNNQADCNQDYPVGSRVFNALGGTQGINGGGYQPIEVKLRLTELAPCYQNGFGFNRSAAFGGCTGGTNPNDPAWRSYTRAVAIVANELQDLDDKPWQGDFNHVGRTVNDTWGTRFKSTTVLPYELELATVTGYDRYERLVDIDLDFSPSTLFHIKTQDHGRQFYQDAKLSGETPILGDTPVSWDIGGWVFDEQIDVRIDNDFGRASGFAIGTRDYTQELTSMAGYGNFSFDFWDDFTLDGGVRWNWERKQIAYQLGEAGGSFRTSLNEADNWRAPTGTIKLTYRFREDTYSYWKYNRGWKPGHYNATGTRTSGVTTADPETIDAWETGLHAEWFGGLLGGEASLFYYNYKDYQIFYAQQFADSSPEFLVINANDAEVYGAEIDALLRPLPGGYVNVRFGWLETQFLDFVTIQQTTRGSPTGQIVVEREIQNSGNPLLNSPRFKVSFTAEQAIPLGKYGYLVPRYDGSWTDTTYYNAQKGRGIPNIQQVQFLPKRTTAQGPYWLHNAQIAYRTPDGRLELAFWVRNIGDYPVKAFGFDGSVFQNTTIYFVGDPRTYGGRATVTF